MYNDIRWPMVPAIVKASKESAAFPHDLRGSIENWLVVEPTPLKNYEGQFGMIIPKYGSKKNVPTTN